MQLIIDICESDLILIIEGTIKRLLKYNSDPYYSASNGELADYLQQQTKYALRQQIDNFDLEKHVAETFKTCFDAIVTDTVNKEIERVVKNKIREMKSKYELSI